MPATSWAGARAGRVPLPSHFPVWTKSLSGSACPARLVLCDPLLDHLLHELHRERLVYRRRGSEHVVE